MDPEALRILESPDHVHQSLEPKRCQTVGCGTVLAATNHQIGYCFKCQSGIQRTSLLNGFGPSITIFRQGPPRVV
jgi:hypothetical protein